tara:strand:- start:270 stop:1244 length:975 start_codon:yes stop_codon:yes gene_type:complete
LGYHTEDKEKLKTIDLPWAAPVLPITSSGISGIGQTPLGLVEGSWVFGFFRDSHYAQEPVIMGSLPGRPSESAGATGFYDPNKIYPKHIDEPDVNRLAVNDADKLAPSLVTRREGRITGIATADFDALTAANSYAIAASDTDSWDQPEIAYAAKYPYDHVYESESGHILEFDDTDKAERIYLAHKGGSSIEYNPNDDRVDIIKANQYTLITSNNKVSIGGQSDISIDGRHKVYINKAGEADNNYDIQVGPNANVNVQVDKGNINLVTKGEGKINVNAGGDYNLKVGGNYTSRVMGWKIETIDGTKTSNTTGAVIHRGSTIDLNP